MFRRLICFSLLIAILCSQSSKLFIYFSFKINQEYIAKELCENREVPKMNCHGKCYLVKQLKQEEQKQENNEKAPVKQRISLDVLCFVKQPALILLTQYKSAQKISCLRSDFSLQKGYSVKVFQPPRVV